MALWHVCNAPYHGLPPTSMPSLGLGVCPCCDKPRRSQPQLRSHAPDDLAYGTMLATKRTSVMHLVIVSGFVAAPSESRRAGSEALGVHSRNCHVQIYTQGRGVPSPSLRASGPKLEICLLERRSSIQSSSLHPTRM